MSDLAWVPQSCTLPAEERPLRVAEWDALSAERLTSLSRPGPLRLHLDLAGGPGIKERVRDLAEREGGCCWFFAFAVTPGGDLIGLDIAVDQQHAAVPRLAASRVTGELDCGDEQDHGQRGDEYQVREHPEQQPAQHCPGD
ncbi:hypothetical protein AB0D87_40820 [Streptomyces sp. NPDC048342]|uniref:hypothetical protein n=1 Tax=unclassified Streptomyces TaxID=2593676 RepID=UPI00341567C3